MPLPRGFKGGGGVPRTSRTVLAGLAAVGMLCVGGHAQAQTLTEALAYAYNNNPQLLAQRAAPLLDVYELHDPAYARHLEVTVKSSTNE